MNTIRWLMYTCRRVVQPEFDDFTEKNSVNLRKRFHCARCYCGNVFIMCICYKYLKIGEKILKYLAKMISFWDPALAGKAMIEAAVKVLNGETLEDGVDLGVEGYHSMKLEGNVLTGDAWIDVTDENVDDPEYDF